MGGELWEMGGKKLGGGSGRREGGGGNGEVEAGKEGGSLYHTSYSFNFWDKNVF